MASMWAPHHRRMPAGAVSKQKCHAETGFHWFVLQEAFERYVMPTAGHASRKKEAAYFLAGLKWIHQGTPTRLMQSHLGMTDNTFRNQVHPLLDRLASTMSIVTWSDRLHPLNHTPEFPYYVTSVVDTAPIYVSESVNEEFSRLLFAPKYGGTALKLEITCSLMGHIIDFKFPAGLGTQPDNTIHNQRIRSGEKQYLPWELSIGDGAYRQCPHIIAKYPENVNYLYDPATGKRDVKVRHHPYQRAHNQRVDKNRQRIEHIVGLVNVKHRLFTIKYQGEWRPLINAVHVVCQLTQLQILRSCKNGTAANGFSRYNDTIGPWRHDEPDHVNLPHW